MTVTSVELGFAAAGLVFVFGIVPGAAVACDVRTTPPEPADDLDHTGDSPCTTSRTSRR